MGARSTCATQCGQEIRWKACVVKERRSNIERQGQNAATVASGFQTGGKHVQEEHAAFRRSKPQWRRDLFEEWCSPTTCAVWQATTQVRSSRCTFASVRLGCVMPCINGSFRFVTQLIGRRAREKPAVAENVNAWRVSREASCVRKSSSYARLLQSMLDQWP